MRQPVPFGKYLLLDRISVGGMAEVFKAKSYGVEGFEKIIAIKRILPTMGEDRDFIKMFIDEAKIAGQLAHANICQIFELGRIDGSHFIAMEYIWGKDLLQIQNRLRKLKQPMPVPMACFVIAKALEGLDYAHRKRDPLGRPLEIVHRDCSPQNVLVSYEGEVKVIDFGIAKATSRNSRTMAGVLKGKFGYMSPEQVRGLPLDRRSDIFALGTMLYECLTSERLFQGETDFSTLEKVRNVDIRPPREVNSAIPEHVERVILKALAKDVDDRYQWCSEMLADIQQFLMSQDVVFTAKSLSSWLKEAFSPEIDRERQQLEGYKRVGRDGLIQGVPAADVKVDVVASLGEAGAPEGDATQLGGPNFEDMDSVPTTPPSGGSGGVAGHAAGHATPPGVQLGKAGAPNPVGHHTPPPAVNGGPKPLGKPNAPLVASSPMPSAPLAPPARAKTNDDDDGFGEEAPTEIFGDADNASKPNPALQLGQPGAPTAPLKKPSGTPSPVLQQPPQPPQRTTSPQGTVGTNGPGERRTPPPERDRPPANPTMPLNPSAGMMPSGPSAGMMPPPPSGQTSPPPLATAPTAVSPMLGAPPPLSQQPQQQQQPQPAYGGYNPYAQQDPQQLQQQPQYDAYGQPMMAMGTPGAVPMMGQPSKTILGQTAPPGLGQYRPTTQPGTQAPQGPQNQSGSVQALPYGQPMPTPQQQPIQNPYGYSQQYAQQPMQQMHPSQPHMTYDQYGQQMPMQSGMQPNMYPSQPMMGGYPMAPSQMSQPMSALAPDEVVPVEGRKKSTLVRDIMIGVLIACLVVGGFLAVKFLVLDGDDSSSTDSSSSTIASVKMKLPTGVTAAVYVDDKKEPEFKAVADGQTLPIAAGKRKIRIEAAQGKCEREVDLPGGEITELECPLAGGSGAAAGTGSDGGTTGSASTGSAGAGSASASIKTPAGTGAGSAVSTAAGTGSGSAATEVADNTSKKPPDTSKKPPDTTTQVKPPDTAKKPPEGPVLPKEDKGWLTVTCKPPAKITVDGAATGMTTPISGHALALAPGKHKITFAIGEDRYSFWVTITAGQATGLTKDFGPQ